ncbi:ABC transporter ATP-binding protein [Lacihabitans soyangensis]|uniref:ABC transporter ATP-binding protein n=1 Tax=Lacihabitans soyangensis TaxID=869394 RepID=A0AAE3KXC0_9BACT|nr:ABC transporter ATP-binding protein [Lacihabitans soyangensis]MCP9764590.1 ABC transporter ATP-binding protein [Lacihabitans soyangensis]
MKELAHLNKYFFKYKFYLFWGIVFTLISNLFGIVPAQVVRHALEMVKANIALYFLFENSSLQVSSYKIITFSIAVFGVLILAMAILKGIFLFAVRQTLIVMSRHIEYDLKNEIYAHYQTLPLSFYKKNSTGDLMARISEDVSKVRMYIGPSLMYLINMVILVFLVLSYMFSVNARLTWFVLIPMPILSLSIFLVSSIINKKSEKIQKSLSNLSTFVQEAFSGIRIIKSFAKEEKFVETFTKESENYRKESLSLTKVDALFSPAISFLIGLSTVICVYVGGQEIIAGKITAGNITEFIMYVFMLTWPLTALGWTSGQIQRAAASQKRINEFLKIRTDIISSENKNQDLQGKISFQNVSFTYPDTGIKALKNISFDIKEGESIAIIGSTGSGKSTIANLLFRMYDADEGKILFDDTDIKALNISNFRNQLAYVPQDVFLFSETIRNNIKFGINGVADSEIYESAKKAEIYNNIMDFEEGFDTKIGERGITLSGGQKQRISIARAIIRNPKILVLDDCLSAVDTNTENAILNNLREIMKDKTTFLISHRVSNARLADKIIVLDDGKIVEQGTHEELLATAGMYRDLYEKQSYSETVPS